MQLANLVEQINVENEMLEDDHRPTTPINPDVLLDDDRASASFNELSAFAESLLANIETSNDETNLDADESNYLLDDDDIVGRIARDMEGRFRRYVDKLKADERARYEAQLQRHVAKLKRWPNNRSKPRYSRNASDIEKFL